MSNAPVRRREHGSGRRDLRPRREDYDNAIDSRDDDAEQIERPHGQSSDGPEEAVALVGLARNRRRSSPDEYEETPDSSAAERAGRTRCPDRPDSPVDAQRHGAYTGREAAGDDQLDGRERPRPEVRRFEDLRKHPAQDYFFNDLSDVEIRDLAEDIRARGLANPIEILPTNRAGLPADTILKGHQRIRALRLLGKTEYKVVVRYDLAEADLAEIELEFVDDNLHRRQLDKLSLAKVARRRYELEKARPGDQCRPAGDARDRVGEAIKMSGRNLDRYWSILDLPSAIQDAFRKGLLFLDMTAKLANLPGGQVAEIARRIEEGTDPRTVVRSCLPTRSRSTAPSEKRLAARLADLRAAIENLDSELRKRGSLGPEELEVLRETGARLSSIIGSYIEGATRAASATDRCDSGRGT